MTEPTLCNVQLHIGGICFANNRQNLQAVCVLEVKDKTLMSHRLPVVLKCFKAGEGVHAFVRR